MAEGRRRFPGRKSLVCFAAAFVVLSGAHVWYASTVPVKCRCVQSDDGRSVEYQIVVASHRACDVFVVRRAVDGSESIESVSSGGGGFPWRLHGLATFRSKETGSMVVDEGARAHVPAAIDARIFRDREWPLWSTPAGEDGPAEHRFLIVRQF